MVQSRSQRGCRRRCPPSPRRVTLCGPRWQVAPGVGQAVRRQDGDWEPAREDTLVTPALTLPPDAPPRRHRGAFPSVHLADTASTAIVVRPPATLGVRDRKARVRSLQAEGVDFIPGRKRATGLLTSERRGARAETASFIRRHKTFILVLAVITIASITVGTASGTFSAITTWANPNWSAQSQSQLAPTPTPPRTRYHQRRALRSYVRLRYPERTRSRSLGPSSND